MAPRWMGLCLLALALAGPGAILVPVTARAADAQDGELVVVVFEVETGRPLAGRPVFAGDRALGVTDGRGQLRVALEPGTHEVSVETVSGSLEGIGAIRIVAGQTSEALVTWFPDGRAPAALVEVPDAPPSSGAGEPTDAVSGTIRGRVVSSETGEPVADARVFVRGTRIDARSGPDGTFELFVGVGARDLSIVHDRFATQAVNNVEVTVDAPVVLDVELVPAGLALGDFTIRAPRIEGGTGALLDERRTASVVGDVLGAEQMSKSGDSSAAGALSRVTGLSVVGGRYVYVRGLGERYSSTLLNGATLPSPEPDQRVVPLDMFPAAVLESVVIQKTYSPDMPGEFGGGSIQLRTRNIPVEPVLQLSLSGGANSVTTFREGLDYQGSRFDLLGAGAGGRRLPDDVLAASKDARLAPSDRFCETNCYTNEDLERLGEQMPNNWAVTPRSLPPDLGLSLTAGTGSETALFGRPAGVLFASSFSNTWQHREYTSRYFSLSADALSLNNAYDFVATENRVDWSNILALGTSPAEGHEIRATSLLLRRTSDEARVFSGYYDDLDADIRTSRLRYVERMLLVQQLSGEHELGDAATWTWRASLALATRIEPDRRSTQYDQNASGAYLMSPRAAGNARFFSTLGDRNQDFGTELSIPVGPEVGEDAFRPTVRVGGMFARKTRAVDTRRFWFVPRGDGARDEALNQKEPGEILTPENIGPDAYQFEEITLPTDNYGADHTLAAGYAMAEIPFTPWLRAMAGARVEHSDQYVVTFRLFDEELSPVEATIKTTDVLPAFTATLSPTSKANVRLGWGRTVSRPDFREMSPAQFSDVSGGRKVVGNDQLRRARIDNLDARLELYPSPSESMSLGVFYKDFQDPIETTLRIGAERATTWENVNGAWLWGAELDLRKKLDFVSPYLRDFAVAGNVALIRSRVDLVGITGTQTSTVRPMQGQSPYVVNLSVGYDNPESRSFVTVLYNVAGPWIVAAGAQGQPDTYQQPIHTLDAVIGVSLPGDFRLGAKLGNLLDTQSVQTMGTPEGPYGYEETERVRSGIDAQLKLTWER